MIWRGWRWLALNNIFVSMTSACALLLFSSPAPANSQEISVISLRPPDWISETKFTGVTSVRELSNGILVADRAEGRLVFLDWVSQEAAVVGRVGEGPGEYRGVGRLYPLPGDSTLFIDSYNGRWNLLVGAGFATDHEPSPLNGIIGKNLAGADAEGAVLGELGLHYTPRRSDLRGPPDSLLLLMGRRESARFDTIARLRGLGSAGVTRLPARGGQLAAVVGNNPLASKDEALLFPDGWVAIARTEPYRVDWRAPDGRWRGGSPLPIQRIRLDRHEKCAAWIRWFGPGRPCEPDLLPGWPEVLPPFLPDNRSSVLFAAPGGQLVITRAPSADASGPRYDVVDRGGRLAGQLQLEPGIRLIGFGAGSVYTLSTDPLGLQTLRRHPWP